jgi:DNA-binding CsgD family transcriptional regulator
MLLGRSSDCEVLDRLLEGVRGGRSGVLVVRGEAGVGKTALLEYAIESASDLRVVRAVGAESEMELVFASLHQLCAPMLDRIDRLPGPQHDALGIAFGLKAGAVPDRFFVGLAVLSLLSEVAEERPLICVVDDAQWLDRASAQTLGFVARRLLAESVLVLFAVREPGAELSGLPELEVRGLRDADARELLGSVIRGPLDERVRERIVAEARGNPLALLELPRGLSSAQLAGGFGLPGAPSLPGRIEESFQRRLGDLPEETQRLLLVAAAEPVGDPALLWAAAQRLGIAAEALAPAESAGLLEVGARVRFRHPLVRSAVYWSASLPERRAAHQALAEATDRELDPDRRAWHLSAASAGPDEEVASELELSAGRAQARGGLSAAAAFLERSAALTVDPARRTQRALVAAETSYLAGAFDGALKLLTVVESGSMTELQRGRADLLRGRLAAGSRWASDACPLLLNAAKRLEPFDLELAMRTYHDAFYAAITAGRFATEGGTVVDVAHAVRAVPARSRPDPPDLLLKGLAALITDGYASGAPVIKRALTGFCNQATFRDEAFLWLPLACKMAHDTWDDQSWLVLSTRLIDEAREAGALTALTYGLIFFGALQLFSSGTLVAGSITEERDAIVAATGSRLPPTATVSVVSWRGEEAELQRLIAAHTDEAVARGDGAWVSAAQLGSAVLYNGLGRYDEALAAAEQGSAYPDELGLANWSMVELVEAASRRGAPERAAGALERLSEMAGACQTDWALGIEARSCALVATDESADRLYREAIDRLGRTRLRAHLARTHLVYGEWLRRERRRQDAREQLRTAYEMLTGMGIEAFAERAERELLATGERVRKRTVETREDLTAQELQVAQMARDGLSNSEIGARLFISPRTVEYHLHKVFTKLNISGRDELDGALPREQSRALAV